MFIIVLFFYKMKGGLYLNSHIQAPCYRGFISLPSVDELCRKMLAYKTANNINRQKMSNNKLYRILSVSQSLKKSQMSVSRKSLVHVQ